MQLTPETRDDIAQRMERLQVVIEAALAEGWTFQPGYTFMPLAKVCCPMAAPLVFGMPENERAFNAQEYVAKLTGLPEHFIQGATAGFDDTAFTPATFEHIPVMRLGFDYGQALRRIYAPGGLRALGPSRFATV